jgi:hypothetical protein
MIQHGFVSILPGLPSAAIRKMFPPKCLFSIGGLMPEFLQNRFAIFVVVGVDGGGRPKGALCLLNGFLVVLSVVFVRRAVLG